MELGGRLLTKLSKQIAEIELQPGADGEQGLQGERGLQGEKGDDGDDVDMTLVNELIVRLIVLEETIRDTPSGPPGYLPIQYESGVSHYILVGDQNDTAWPSIHSWARRAREVHPFIKIIYRGRIPSSVIVEAWPQLISYDLGGNERTRDLGQFEVERALQRIARSEF